MPQVAKVMAIRPRKTWMRRLYLWTRSNKARARRAETNRQFYRTLVLRSRAFLAQLHAIVRAITASIRSHRADTVHSHSRSSIGLDAYSKYTVPSSRSSGIRVTVPEFAFSIPPLFDFRALAQSGKPLNNPRPALTPCDYTAGFCR